MLDNAHMMISGDDGVSLREQFRETIAERADFDILLGYFNRMEVEGGECLIRQGDPSDDLFLIEKGQVTAHLEVADRKALRLRTIRAGAIVGELGMILGEERSATVIADRHSTVYRLTKEALLKMESEQPDVAVSFHRFITHLVAERLSNTDKAIKLILD